MVWRTLSNDCLDPIDGMGGLPWYGERYPMIALSRSMGWADCHGMENVITMIALSRSMGWADCHGMGNVIQ